MVEMSSDHPLRVIHDTLAEISTELHRLSIKLIEVREQLHIIDELQRRIDEYTESEE
ncbi:MAG: hypothetical protein GF411_03075 [Candidatus Lokiarchaeota archaeon]|nr:hypothetical protein [Candidatus Lokiarchaeota archaeon]